MKSHNLNVDLDLDSFLDILTNVIGVMILVATVIALQLQSTTKVELGRPLLHAPPSNAERVWLECREGRLFYFDVEKYLSEAIQAANAEFGEHCTWDTVFPYVNSLNLGDENYTLRFEYDSEGRRYVRAEFNPETHGGLHVNAKDDAHGFEEWLVEEYHPDSHYFIVLLFRSGAGSFSQFQKKANELGFEMGWTLTDDEGFTIRYLDDAPEGFAQELVD